MNDDFQFFKCLWHFQRHDEQGNGKCKNGITESFYPLNFFTPKMEYGVAFSEEFFADHTCIKLKGNSFFNYDFCHGNN